MLVRAKAPVAVGAQVSAVCSSRMGGGSRTHLHGMKKGRRSAPNFTQLISKGSGDRDLRLRRFLAVRIAKHIAAAPDGLDVVGAAASES